MSVPPVRPVTVAAAARPAVGLVVGILVLCTSVSIMSTDMYAPSLPELALHFDASPTLVQLTISLNMLAFGLAQLVHGPLSDRYGRRPVLLASLVAVAVLCLACSAAQSIGQLIAARILLGIAAAAEAVIGLAILKDLYDEREQVRALALLGTVIGVAPALAPIAGGYLLVHFGWRSNFYVIAVGALAAFAVAKALLPESTVADPGALRLRRIGAGYLGLLRNAEFVAHTLMLGCALGLIMVFVTGAPFVLIEGHGVPPERFGWYQAAIVVPFFFGSLFASRVADVWEGARLLRLGTALVVTGATVLGIVVLGGLETPVTFTLAYMLMTLGMGPLFAAAPSLALRSVEGQAGTASALLSGIEQTAAAAGAVAVSLLNDGTSRPVAWVTIALAVALLALYRTVRPGCG